ncbi:MAG: hypothetical protein AUK63_808 [bacterium P3]|nr:MAG: hypothetical protein AUK63_808 [bacterium P3]KWW41877.1 MAG: hypothetical protein F083_805 [bacterium F083]
MKKYIWTTVASIIVASAITFSGCSKEKTEEESEPKSVVNNFEWIGKLHNETLWNIGVDFQEDLQIIVENNSISEEELLIFQEKVEDWARRRCSQMMGTEYNGLIEEWHLDMKKTAEGFMADQMLNDFLYKATSIEDLIEAIKEKEAEVSFEMKSMADTAKLMSLIVMRSSIEFWSDAYYNQENPWHELVYNYPIFSADTKGLPELWGKVKKWITDNVAPIVETVVEVVCTTITLAASDVWLFGECFPGFTVATGGPVGGAIGAGLVAGAGSAVGGACGYAGSSWLFNK